MREKLLDPLGLKHTYLAEYENHTEEKAETWAKGIVANMARSPKGNDRDQVKAVVAGEGDVAIETFGDLSFGELSFGELACCQAKTFQIKF